ncbi:MAG: hypothetical protein ACRDND_08595 [Streptosporangiaceae bacterium]
MRAQGRAREAASTQVAPLARSTQEKAGRGLLSARAWTAPRVERTGVAVQERLAPRVSEMMAATARRIEPPKASRRRRWPIAAGIVVLGAGCIAAAQVLRSKRNTVAAEPGPVPPEPMPPATAAGHREMTEAQADVNGQVRTP